ARRLVQERGRDDDLDGAPAGQEGDAVPQGREARQAAAARAAREQVLLDVVVVVPGRVPQPVVHQGGEGDGPLAAAHASPSMHARRRARARWRTTRTLPGLMPSSSPISSESRSAY